MYECIIIMNDYIMVSMYSVYVKYDIQVCASVLFNRYVHEFQRDTCTQKVLHLVVKTWARGHYGI